MLARTAARSLAFLAHVDPGETTVSAEDDQGVRHRVFCDNRLDSGRRCVLRADHETPCAARLPRCASERRPPAPLTNWAAESSLSRRPM